MPLRIRSDRRTKNPGPGTDQEPSAKPQVPVRRARHVTPVLGALAREIDGLDLPAVEKISESSQEDPFKILIGTLLSARTQDATTAAASARLFAKAPTPKAMLTLTVKQIEKLIYPVSFYRHKAKHVKATCRILL